MEGKLVPSKKGTSLLEVDNGFRYGTHHPMSEGQVHCICLKKNAKIPCVIYAAIYNPSKNEIVKNKENVRTIYKNFSKRRF